MFAAQLTLDLPEVSDVPVWVYAVACVVGWYAVWGVILRWWFGPRPKAWFNAEDWSLSRSFAWLLCPVILPAAVVWTMLAVVSFGIIPFPWKSITRPNSG